MQIAREIDKGRRMIHRFTWGMDGGTPGARRRFHLAYCTLTDTASAIT